MHNTVDDSDPDLCSTNTTGPIKEFIPVTQTTGASNAFSVNDHANPASVHG